MLFGSGRPALSPQFEWGVDPTDIRDRQQDSDYYRYECEPIAIFNWPHHRRGNYLAEAQDR